MEQRLIFIYGPPASGKSALGRRLAKALDLPFLDLDEVIESRVGLAIPDIFVNEGEGGFRDHEFEALQSLLTSRQAVIALGGGALLRPTNRAAAEASGTILCLDLPFEMIVTRLEQSAGGRPLLDGDARSQLRDLLTARSDHYASFPLHVDAAMSPSDLVWAAQAALGRFRVTGMGLGYPVHVWPGGMAWLGQAMRELELSGPVALVTDENVASQHMPAAVESLLAAGYEVHSIQLPPGEQHKTVGTIQQLWDGFLTAGVERRSTVIALGGGVVGDLTGFAAATFLRGVRWVSVPTSLLAMVDAALGGKTGADLPQGKNLIGAFHPPALVLADPHTLVSLPEVEFCNGLAEVVKHGILADPDLFELCGRGLAAVQAHLDRVVRHAMAVKIQVIVEDPFERGRRASLNLGHTLGHALEIASDFRLRHGEAVAIGMVAAARLSVRRGLAESGLDDQIAGVLAGLGLPVAIPPGLGRDRILAAVGVDKKRSGGQVKVVLPIQIGAARWGEPLNEPAELLAI